MRSVLNTLSKSYLRSLSITLNLSKPLSCCFRWVWFGQEFLSESLETCCVWLVLGVRHYLIGIVMIYRDPDEDPYEPPIGLHLKSRPLHHWTNAKDRYLETLQTTTRTTTRWFRDGIGMELGHMSWCFRWANIGYFRGFSDSWGFHAKKLSSVWRMSHVGKNNVQGSSCWDSNYIWLDVATYYSAHIFAYKC